MIKSILLRSALVAALLLCGGRADAQSPLTLEAKIPLGEVRGRIDHLAVDLARRRLFVAELENDSLGIVDLDARKVMHVIADLKGPQGLGYLASTDTLFVANGGDGSLRMFEGNEYRVADRIHLGDDADNVRLDAELGQVLVAYGDGALAIIDAVNRKKIGDIALRAHPESFQLDRRTNRIYVNDPKGQAIVVVDSAAGKPAATWSTGNATNFAMALDEAANRVLVALRNPASLVAFAAADGARVASADSCGDADDMFVDAKRRRVYVSCGEGFVDVFAADGGAYRRIAHVPTVAGARTSLYVPDLDRLFLAARATPEAPAAVWVFRPEP
jgi:DNA-binding beta-propeller fold protein YncE